MKLDSVRLSTEAFICAVSESGQCGKLRWELGNDDQRFTFRLHSDGETEIRHISAFFRFPFEKHDMLYLNGYQSWTDSRERGVRGKMHSLNRVPKKLVEKYSLDRYGDNRFVEYGKKPGRQHGFSYGYVRRGEEFTLFGSLAEESGFTILRFDTNENTITLEKDCAGHHFTGDYTVFDMVILRGTEDEVFDEYFRLLNIPPAKAKRLTGYTSWYNLYENISEKSIAADLKGFAGSKKLPDVFQIDDGYENAVGDWLIQNERFPHGMKAAADSIREAGMLPGIWLAPFAAEKKSILVKEHPDWLLRDENGEPQMGGCNWSGFYGLEIYNPEVRAYLKEVFDTVIRGWGYGLVKLDFLYAACLIPRRDKTRAQVMYDGMRFLRQLAGDALILGCGVPLAPAFGMVDYCRIGCDMTLNWLGDKIMRPLHREVPSTRNTLLNTVYRRHLDGRAWRNDPDVFLLRDDNIKLSMEQRETLAAGNALFGGVLFTSDNVGAYDEEKRAVYERIEKLDRSCVTKIISTPSKLTIHYREGKKKRFYNKCWGSEAERLSYTQHFS